MLAAFAEVAGGKLRPLGRGTGDFLAEHLFAPGHLELVRLSALVLGGGRHARVAVNHAHNSASEICIGKSQFHQGHADDADILIYAHYHKRLMRGGNR